MEVRGAFTHLGQSLAQSRKDAKKMEEVLASLRLCARYDLSFDLRETTTQGGSWTEPGGALPRFPRLLLSCRCSSLLGKSYKSLRARSVSDVSAANFS